MMSFTELCDSHDTHRCIYTHSIHVAAEDFIMNCKFTCIPNQLIFIKVELFSWPASGCLNKIAVEKKNTERLESGY